MKTRRGTTTKLVMMSAFVALVSLVIASLSLAAPLATYNLTFGPGYPGASQMSGTTAQHLTGAGSWSYVKPGGAEKAEIYFDPAATFGSSFTIDQIQSVTYHTVNGATNPSNTDFYMLFYTMPCTGGDSTWYCHRLTAEPMYSIGYVGPTAWVWNTFTTDAGVNQLAFNDSWKTMNQGFYNGPTLQAIQAGPIDWSTYSPGALTTPVDYGPETVKYIVFSTGSAWTTFEGYLDGITIQLTTGDVYNIDLENFADPVFVDDGWALSTPGEEVETGKFFGWNAFAKIQDGIDNVAAGGTVDVFPGIYDETASNRFLYNGSGPYQFGLFFDGTRDGLTVRGVDAAGTAIENPAHLEATITTNATNSFGTSGTFVEADGVTLQGLEFGPNIPGDNKAIEVIGDGFTLLYSVTNIPPEGGSVYINDWRYDDLTDTSYLKSYRVEGNWFKDATSVDVSSGAGFTGPASGRIIKKNTWDMKGTSWNAISFNGVVPSVGWFTYPVGGATITENSFNNAGVSFIRARGVYDEASFDWDSYWNDNSFDKAVVGGINPPLDVQEYSYTSDVYVFDHVRRIGVTVQGEVDNAVSGNTILVKTGVYEEAVVVDGKTLTLKGEVPGATIKAPAIVPICFSTSYDYRPVVCAKNNSTLTVDTLTVDGAGLGNSNYRFVGVAFRNSAGTVINSVVKDIRDTPFSGAQHGVGIYAYNDDGISPRSMYWITRSLASRRMLWRLMPAIPLRWLWMSMATRSQALVPRQSRRRTASRSGPIWVQAMSTTTR